MSDELRAAANAVLTDADEIDAIGGQREMMVYGAAVEVRVVRRTQIERLRDALARHADDGDALAAKTARIEELAALCEAKDQQLIEAGEIIRSLLPPDLLLRFAKNLAEAFGNDEEPRIARARNLLAALGVPEGGR